MSMACFSLSQVAYLAPDLVLPLVHQRFEVPSRGLTIPLCLFIGKPNTVMSSYAVHNSCDPAHFLSMPCKERLSYVMSSSACHVPGKPARLRHH